MKKKHRQRPIGRQFLTTLIVSIILSGVVVAASLSLALAVPRFDDDGETNLPPVSSSSSSSKTSSPSSSSAQNGVSPKARPFAKCYHLQNPCKETIKEQCVSVVACNDPMCNLGFCVIDQAFVKPPAETPPPKSFSSARSSSDGIIIKRILPFEHDIDTSEREESSTFPTRGIVPLGCFATNSTWTDQRAACDQNQRHYFWKEETIGTDTSNNDEEVRHSIGTKFVDSAEGGNARKGLLSSIDAATERLKILSDSKVLTGDGQNFLARSIEWFNTIRPIFSVPGRDIDTIHVTAKHVEEVLHNVSTLVDAAIHAKKISVASNAQQRSTIDGIFAKVITIVERLPQAFEVLKRESIAIPSDATIAFSDAQKSLAAANLDCQKDLDACSRLSGVIDALGRVSASVQNAIAAAGKANLRAEIEGIFSK